MKHAAIVVLALCLCACQPEIKHVGSTEVLVRVEASPEVRAMTATLRIRTSTQQEAGSDWVDHSFESVPAVDYNGKPTPFWPADIPIVPFNVNSPPQLFEIVIEALSSNGTVLVEQRAITSFIKQAQLVLTLTLKSCGDKQLGMVCEKNVDCHGTLCQSCRAGSCMNTEVTAPQVAASGSALNPSFDAGGYHTCMLREHGAVACWGDNSYGQLGDGSTISRSTPATVTGLSNAIAVSAGEANTCAITQGGTVACWGFDWSAMLADAFTLTTRSAIPVSVTGLTTATAVTVGFFHACAVTQGGTVACWGASGAGQLGDGSTSKQSALPVTVTGLADATAVSAGHGHTCALMHGGTVACWGFNNAGQLGDGTTINRPVAVGVTGMTKATAVTGGFGHSCALTQGGTVACWGDNSDGQLGDGSTINRSTAVTVTGVTNAIAVAAGENHTCALKLEGTVACWGNNSNGQLGDGTATNRSTAVSASGLSYATAVSAGSNHTCALTQGGAVACWGDNSYGQLGDGSTINRSTAVTN